MTAKTIATTVFNNKSIINAGTFGHTSLGDYTLSVNANQSIGVTGNVTEDFDGTQDTTAGGNITIVGGPDINLNP